MVEQFDSLKAPKHSDARVASTDDHQEKPSSAFDDLHKSMSSKPNREVAQNDQAAAFLQGMNEEQFTKKNAQDIRAQFGLKENATSTELYKAIGDESYKQLKQLNDTIKEESKHPTQNRDSLSELKQERAKDLHELHLTNVSEKDLTPEKVRSAIVNADIAREGITPKQLSGKSEEEQLKIIEAGMHKKLYSDLKSGKIEIDKD